MCCTYLLRTLLTPGLLLALAVADLPGQQATMTPEKKAALDWIQAHRADSDEVAVYVWEHPELSLAEFKSSKKLQDYLRDNGFEIKTGISGIETAFIATWGSGTPVISFIGEYDALPGLSQERGVAEERPVAAGAPGHGCGHNLIGAASATAAIATARAMLLHGLKGTVRFHGTPGEEACAAKAFMARDGAWDDVDVALCWHPGQEVSAGYGTSLAVHNLKLRFHGGSARSADSAMGGNPLDGVELLVMGTNQMKRHLPDRTRVDHVITAGGEAPNVVPATAEAWYFLRAPRWAQVEKMSEWTKQVAEGAALMSGTKVEIQTIDAMMELLPNKALTRLADANIALVGPPRFSAEDERFAAEVSRALERLGAKGEQAAYFDTEIHHPNLDPTFPDVPGGRYSTDVGNVSWVTPTVSFGAPTWVRGTINHSWVVVAQGAARPALTATLSASKWMAATALDLVMDPRLLKEIKEEHQKQLAQSPFRHPIPKDLRVPTFREVHGRDWESIPKPATYRQP